MIQEEENVAVLTADSEI